MVARMGLRLMLVVVCVLSIGSMVAHADSIITYSGIDTSPARTNSDGAAAAFTAAAGGVATIDFENAPVGAYTGPLSLGDGVTLTSANIMNTGADATGIVNTSVLQGFNTTPGGSNYFQFTTQAITFGQTTTATATFDFANGPIDSFGTYLTGLCSTDYRSELVQLNFSNGSSQAITLNGSPNCGMEFWGFTDQGAQISSISITQSFTNTFSQTQSWLYGIGIDDVKYHSVPEPGSLLLLGTGLAGLGSLRKKFGRRA